MKARRKEKWKKSEHRKDYARFKPNEERVTKDSNHRENVASEIVSTPLLNSVSTSSISDYLFPAQSDSSAESFDNYDHEMFCLLQSLPMDNSTLEQTDISVDSLIHKNVKNQSVSGIDFNVSINYGNIAGNEYLVQV